MIPAGARCGLHQDVAAVDLCKRCGRFLCGECVQLNGEDAYCADCVGRLDGPPSRLSTVTLIAGIVALTCNVAIIALIGSTASFAEGLEAIREMGRVVEGVTLLRNPTTVVAAIAGFTELVRISRGRASPRGRRRAIAGLVMALINILLFGGASLYWVLRTAHTAP